MTVSNSTFIWANIFGPYNDGGGNAFGNARPVIGAFTAGPTQVTAGSTVTLTMTNITDANPNSNITQVTYQGYSNGTSSTGVYSYVAYFTQSSPGVWTYSFSTAGWAPGTYTFFAVAENNYGVDSAVVSTANTVQII
jgi:hypothetical protein